MWNFTWFERRPEMVREVGPPWAYHTIHICRAEASAEAGTNMICLWDPPLIRSCYEASNANNNRSQIRSLSYADWFWTSDFQAPSVRQHWRVRQPLEYAPLQVGQEYRLEYTRPSVFRVTNQKLTTWQNWPKRAYPLQSLAFVEHGPAAHRKIIFMEKNWKRRNGAWESVGTTGDFGAVYSVAPPGGQGEIRTAGGEGSYIILLQPSAVKLSQQSKGADGRWSNYSTNQHAKGSGSRKTASQIIGPAWLPKWHRFPPPFDHSVTKPNGLTNSDLFRRRSANEIVRGQAEPTGIRDKERHSRSPCKMGTFLDLR